MSAELHDDNLSGTLIFFCNGRKIVDHHVDVKLTLLAYLRSKLLLTGSKLGCGEGGCGSCTVMVSKYSQNDNKISNIAVNGCLIPICYVHGMAVTTVEGIGSTRTKLHPVQERIAKAHGSQCGYCTPGIVMSMYALLRNQPQPTMEEIENAFQGNLCRCTGYRSILQGYKSFTKGGCSGVDNGRCCMDNANVNGLEEGIATTLFDPSEFTPYDPSQEIIFPPELMIMLREKNPVIQTFTGNGVSWFRPVTLQGLLDMKANYPQAKLVVGNTEVGVEVKFKNQEYPIIIDGNHVPDLNSIQATSTGISVGASVSLTSLDQYLKDVIQSTPEPKTRVFSAIVEMLRWFAGPQIRNVASLGGNIATGSPISDMNPLLMAAMCSLELISNTGARTVIMDGDFFTAYRTNIIKSEEIILCVNIPYTSENEYFYGYKQASRREDDIAIVNAGMRVIFQQGTAVVNDCTLAFGGMAPTTVLAKKTMQNIKGRNWNDDMFSAMCPLLSEELPLVPGAPGGMETYRQSLILGFFFKFYVTVLEQINLKLPGLSGSSIPACIKSATDPYHKQSSRGVQMFQEVPTGQLDSDAVGRPVLHQAALQHATGEAVYVDDIPPAKGELYIGLVLSEKAHAKLLCVDPTAALGVVGVCEYVDVNDVPGSNLAGPTPVQDEQLYADQEVTSVGQVIGLIVAASQDIAQKAARLVKVEYEELTAVLTIEDAIERNSFFPENYTSNKGNIEEGFENSDHILEGEVKLGAQEHFYLETNSTIVIPRERGAMEVVLATQAPTMAQDMVCRALGIPAHKVVCRTKRVGGAFGGKEVKSGLLAARVAVAAKKVNRPVRIKLDRDEDMCTTGTRHPILGRYKVGFASDGHVRALQLDLYTNSGNSTDVSLLVVQRALLSADNSYNIPNLKVTGHACKTNISSNTCFRGFGSPQCLHIVESIMYRVARKCRLSQIKIRELNFYKEGDVTHYGQELKNCNLERCWDQCLAQSNYENRRREVDIFNSENRWRKRGLAAVPVKYGVGFGVPPLYQAGALVHIYTDGSVLVAHGGTEMGQGLHTKMIQVASRVLRVPQDKIHINDTRTDTVPNTPPTAASFSSDLNGMAIKAACETLLQRLEPYIHENPKGSWENWVMAAYFDRVSLSATGYYISPDITFDNKTFQGKPYKYFSYGAAVSEVHIDCLTGDHRLVRTDIVMDVGDSLNPAVDIGQIEGAFIQGYGLYVLEDYRMSPSGHLLTKGPGLYKIPGFGDIPSEFNVSLLTRAPNPVAICSSKAVGEPPLLLASSVVFAIKDAIQSARNDVGLTGSVCLDSPATSERIRMACEDQFTKQFPEPEQGTYTPFFIRP